MYTEEQNEFGGDDCASFDSQRDASDLFPARIANLEETVERMRRESLLLRSSQETLVKNAATLKQYHSRIIRYRNDSKIPSIDLVELDDYIRSIESKNEGFEKELSNLANDLHSTELLRTHYQDAIFLLRIRHETSRLRLSLKIYHPCGDIHLYSPFVHTLLNKLGKQDNRNPRVATKKVKQAFKQKVSKQRTPQNSLVNMCF